MWPCARLTQSPPYLLHSLIVALCQTNTYPFSTTIFKEFPMVPLCQTNIIFPLHYTCSPLLWPWASLNTKSFHPNTLYYSGLVPDIHICPSFPVSHTSLLWPCASLKTKSFNPNAFSYFSLVPDIHMHPCYPNIPTLPMAVLCQPKHQIFSS